MEKDSKIEELQKTKKAIPRVFSALELCGIEKDNEDWVIYERRCYKSEQIMGIKRHE